MWCQQKTLSPVLEVITLTMEYLSCTVTTLKGRAARSIPSKSYSWSVVSDEPIYKRDQTGLNVMLVGRELDCAGRVMLNVMGYLSWVIMDGRGFDSCTRWDISLFISFSLDSYVVKLGAIFFASFTISTSLASWPHINPIFSEVSVRKWARQTVDRHGSAISFLCSLPWDLRIPPSDLWCNDNNQIWFHLFFTNIKIVRRNRVWNKMK